MCQSAIQWVVFCEMFRIFTQTNRNLSGKHNIGEHLCPILRQKGHRYSPYLRFYSFLLGPVPFLWQKMPQVSAKQIPVSRAFKAAPRECKHVSIPLDLHLNSNFADGFLLSIEMAVFVDRNGKMSTLSIKRGVFMDGSRGYLLYLYDLTENIN